MGGLRQWPFDSVGSTASPAARGRGASTAMCCEDGVGLGSRGPGQCDASVSDADVDRGLASWWPQREFQFLGLVYIVSSFMYGPICLACDFVRCVDLSLFGIA